MADSSSGRRFAAFVAIAFFVALMLVMPRHEMWRDELEAWLAARDSATPVEVVRNTRYNGHPITWYLLLHAVTRVTHDPRGMQLLHAAIATAGVYLFARYAPFSRWQKALFAFGYFPLFEYGVISREYVLGVVLLFAFCAAYAARMNLLVLALLAGLLAQTSVYGLMLSLALVALIIVGLPLMRGRDRRATALAAFAVFVIAAVLSVVQLIPPTDSGMVVGWKFSQSPRLFPLFIVWRALVPVPPIDPQFWNDNIVGSNKRVAPLALLLYPLVLWMLRHHRAALALFGIGSLGLLTFAFVKFSGSIRHFGHVYLLLVAALWIGARVRPLGRRLDLAFTGLLAVHVLAAIVAVSIDWVRPFSQSRAAAEYLRETGLADAFLIGEKDSPAAPIAAYLDRQIYFPRGDRVGSFIIYDQRRLAFDPANLLDVCRARARERGQDVVLIATSPLKDEPPGVERLRAFTDSITGDEDYLIYRVTAH